MITKRTKTALLAVGVFCAGAALLWRPQAVASGVSRGLSVCGGVLIPSLFPFLVLSGFLIRSGVAAAVGRRMGWLTRRLFGLPGCCATGILISLVGGYPAGAAAVRELLQSGQITREDGRRMLRFCVNGGPGFVIGTVGAGLTGSAAFGALLYAASVTSALLLGVVGVPRRLRQQTDDRSHGTAAMPPSAALVESVTGACETLLHMCGFVLLFSAVLAWSDSVGVVEHLAASPQAAQHLSAWLACLLEVSCGCTAAASLGVAAPLLLGFAVGFGGLSVHCQVAATLRGVAAPDAGFLLTRLAQGLLTAVLTTVLFRLVPFSLPTGGSFQQPLVRALYATPAVSVAVLVLLGVWMLTIGTAPVGEKR